MARRILAVLVLAAVAGAVGRGAGPVFYPDDPLPTDPESRDAAGVVAHELSDPYDFLENSFLNRGDHTPQRAVNVNTVDEVPDSSWFTNRLLTARPPTVAEIARGSNVSGPPAPGPWTIVSGKSDGITPGFTVRDTAGTIWFIKFDPPSNPEMATGAELIATKLFWALGYNVPENYPAVLNPDTLVIAETATFKDALGKRRQLTRTDVDEFLAKGARLGDGQFRVIASRALAGTPVGPFKYFGTRPDDPNDIFPHEHRRELRGLRAFSAWLNHDDSRSINTLDTLVEVGGRTIVRHHLIDFGSTLGSASVTAQVARAGNEYIWEARPTLLTMLSLGFWVRPWIKVRYPEFPAVGNIEAAYFWPDKWKPEYPNAAFDNARADDLFWAARRVMAVSDEAIRAVVRTAEYSNQGATDYLGDVIIARRDKVGLQWLTAVNPVVDFALAADGTLTFGNAATATRRASAPEGYEIVWSRFDNATGVATPVGGAPQSVTTERASAPAEVLGGAFVQVAIHTRHPSFPIWRRPVVVHFRRHGTAWDVVGVRRDDDD
ncbi:MAG: hypothetical protein AB7U83_21900 [Vicinamibacterales bacterium]